MNVELAAVLAGGSHHEMLYHLLLDRLLKCAILVAAVLLLAVGMVIVWKKVGGGPKGAERAGDPADDQSADSPSRSDRRML